jgi:hypothetical protein
MLAVIRNQMLTVLGKRRELYVTLSRICDVCTSLLADGPGRGTTRVRCMVLML